MKQVIVVRKDLGMRKGKMIVQGAHASLMAYRVSDYAKTDPWIDEFNQAKICVGVESEAELVRVYEEAQAAGLRAVLVQDAGKTEFKAPTYTAVGIGPDDAEKIDAVTRKLVLL